MDNKPFQIYRSSAGSGKTYQLAKEYIMLGLRDPNAFYKILGVTFTNKATEEMKQRIVSFLKDLSIGELPELSSELATSLEIDSKTVSQRSSDLLSNILHNYGRFAVVTIDSFFHQVIRSFAREMGLQGSFSIELDADTVIEEIVDELLARIGEKEYIKTKKWLIEYAESRVDQGSSWDSRSDVKILAFELLRDEYKPRAEEILRLSDEPGYFNDILKELNQIRFSFEKTVKSIAVEGQKLVEVSGGVDVFKSKSRGPANQFNKAGDLNLEFGPSIRKAVEGADNWLTAENQKNAFLVQQVEQDLIPKSLELLNYVDGNVVEYNSARAVLEYFYTFGILSELTKILRDYREENDVMLIADLPDFLRQIINDSDTPYIYEKVGARFQHYLMDEFQDTSTFQWENFKPLVKNATDEGSRSIAVGDVKQSIYRWRGGDFNLLQNKIEKDIGSYNTHINNLDKNWRSSRQIVEFNNLVFKNTEIFSDIYFEDISSEFTSLIDETKELYFDAQQEVIKKDLQGLVSVNYLTKSDVDDVSEESIRLCIEKVVELQQSGHRLRDMAILVRKKSEGVKVANAFFRAKEDYGNDLRFDVVSSEALYLSSSSLVGFIISLIKWIDNQGDKIVLAEWVYKYQKYILIKDEPDHVLFDRKEKWQEIVPDDFISAIDYLITLPIYELVAGIVRIFELDKKSEEFVYLQGFQDAILDYSKNQRGDIASFLEWWEESGNSRSIQLSDENDAIKILTIHKAKGLEFPIVFIPFLNWDFDPVSGFNKSIIWCDPVDRAPFERMPIIPLRYTKKMSETYWSEDYWKEKIKNYLDALNLLYVALTRPMTALFAFSQKPEKRQVKNVGDALFFLLSEQEEGWDSESNIFQLGTIEVVQSKEQSFAGEYALKSYPCYPWREKAGLQMKGSIELSSEVFVSKLSGIKIHNYLSQIHVLKDIDLVDDEETKEYLRPTLYDDEIRPFFEDVDVVKNEVPILLPGGKIRRIDRLIKKGDRWYVIDFKTGNPDKKHIKQVANYIQLLQKMNYEQVSGRLIYLDRKEVVTI